jgi:hypothetical protein
VNDGALGDYQHYWQNMWNCRSDSDTELAGPGPIAGSGRDFTVNWHNYGTARAANSCSPW